MPRHTPGIGLDVVGSGPALPDFRRQRRANGALPRPPTGDDDVRTLWNAAGPCASRASEDFGITPVEANAAGKPVVAFAAGGALETLDDGVTGAFFTRHEPDDILAAIRRCDRIQTSPEAIAVAARRFSRRAFEAALLAALHTGLRSHHERLGLSREPVHAA